MPGRLTTARSQLHALALTVVADRSFLSQADAGTTLPAVFVDDLAVTELVTAVVCRVEGALVVLCDGADAAQVEMADAYADDLTDALAPNGWAFMRSTPEERLTSSSDDIASSRITGYRITAQRVLRSTS